MRIITSIIISFFTVLVANANSIPDLSSISGKITDAKTNEALFGAKVMVQGMSKGCVVDADGNYVITDLPAGKYTLEIRNQTYNTMVLSDIIVKAKETRVLDIKMEKVVVEFGPVTVYAKINKELDSNEKVGISFNSILSKKDRLKISYAQNKELNYQMVDFHTSRPGHDLRYALDGDLMKELGWVPQVSIEERINQVVRWTLNNDRWLKL